MERYSLPQRAKIIESHDYVIAFGDNKVVFVPESLGQGKHYTLQAGLCSGVVDVHETENCGPGLKRHRTLYAIRRLDIAAVMADLSPIVPALLGCFVH